MSTTVGPIDPDEIKNLYFKFEREVQKATIVSVEVRVEVVRGTDPSPTSAINGAPVIDNTTKIVSQSVKFPNKEGNIYTLKCLATDDRGGVHAVSCTLPVKKMK